MQIGRLSSAAGTVALIALATKAGYIGAMGSRRTHQKRFEALRGARVTDEQLARISAPIGLDIGASAPRSSRWLRAQRRPRARRRPHSRRRVRRRRDFM